MSRLWPNLECGRTLYLNGLITLHSGSRIHFAGFGLIEIYPGLLHPNCTSDPFFKNNALIKHALLNVPDYITDTYLFVTVCDLISVNRSSWIFTNRSFAPQIAEIPNSVRFAPNYVIISFCLSGQSECILTSEKER